MNDRKQSHPIEVGLGGVPETMLWTLHNRAGEARRQDTRLPDPDCVRIYESIDYDYERSFGKANQTHPHRSMMFDAEVLRFLGEHPNGVVVELGAGLETQYQRLQEQAGRWFCVDLPEAIAARRLFLDETETCRYIEKSATDLSWLDDLGDDVDEVFISAQGLLMYFEESDVADLVATAMGRFDDVTLMFDTIPRFFSRKTMSGYNVTEEYIAPPMPWGIAPSAIEPTLKAWSAHVRTVELLPYGAFRGLAARAMPLFRLPLLRNGAPTITVATGGRASGADW
ncbi:MAG: class I SAM-dependent methyltransferase [Actinomycetota bacterium]